MDAAPSSSFTVRLATPADAAILSAIATRTFVQLIGPLYSAEDLAEYLAGAYPVEKMRGEIEDPQRTTVFVFPKDDPHTPCGYSMLTDGSIRHGDEGAACPRDYLEVKRVYVDAAYHGTGVAYVLMDKVMQIVQQKNRKFVWLGTGVTNYRAQKFYRKHGFVVTGKRFFQIGSVPHPDVIMTRHRDENATTPE